MEFKQIYINHMKNPIGFEFDNLFINCEVTANNYPKNLEKRLIITHSDKSIYTTDWQLAKDLNFKPIFKLDSKTRYTVLVKLRSDEKVYSRKAYFETGLINGFHHSQWIGSDDTSIHGISLSKQFTLPKIKQARLYISGLGLYEAYIDGQKVGDEYLAPGFTNYNYYVQIASHDVSSLLQDSGFHTLRIIVGDGWYKGKLGIKNHGGTANQYGNILMANAELDYVDDSKIHHSLGTDITWKTETSQITHSGIYYGEDLDETLSVKSLSTKEFKKPTKHLKDRLSLPIKEHETFYPKTVNTSDRSVVLDFGQNMAGWVTFENTLPKGTKVELQYGEILQKGMLYRDNLRSARATFTYVSDGKKHLIRPHFTYFGFRYVKLVGFPKDIDVNLFCAQALYSDMKQIGRIQTNNSSVNQLFSNIEWGQKSNFIDIPTDCPQRDERLGWTGDAAIFAKTASYNMDTYQFNKKFAFDIAVEQSFRDGKVPLYVPNVDGDDGGKAVWGDVATIVPWITYVRSHDSTILRQNFGAMMSWVDWIHDYAKSTKNEFLWLDSDQLGDWLALDTEDIMHLKGKTPDELIASAYYYQSVRIVAQTALILNAKREHEYYKLLAEKIKEAFIAEFYTASGRLITDTQTALALCLKLKLYPQGSQKRITQKLVGRIEKDQNHLTTGFVGTPALLPALSENGQNDLAVQIFLNDDYPSWLYEVKMGATTIWERWNSVMPDGSISDNGMNSLNHYSTGAVMQWAYEYLLGIKQGESLTIQPEITPKLRKMSGYTELDTGKLNIQWKLVDHQGSKVNLILDLPFANAAKVILPRTNAWIDNGVRHRNGDILSPGHHEISYNPKTNFIDTFNVHTALSQFIDNREITGALKQLVPFWDFIQLPGNIEHFKDYSILQLSREMKGIGFSPLTEEQLEKINQYFRTYAQSQIEEEDELK
ncbi:family 78 glycoside hydrolase catalytic domain [Companilactobacillus alimentarius]|uniref:alpha-L-rhamnosidase n=1 Tax=Companilactobacillus alimentarius DSM 20249 TaxID=1423720 RepID=A0A2K9HH58_9LACO|nr:family 78 glycoside hydrolase catalytic domain [Companilactobacillus alimentarius]AUI71116.1 alfa-L-rhamnosidase [Companilactobacillus alimentarius DSM 20249]GEO43980.1 alpha-L-rhamnosidase [Companilactobacillus alimentarius]